MGCDRLSALDGSTVFEVSGAVIPFARNVWQQTLIDRPAAIARPGL